MKDSLLIIAGSISGSRDRVALDNICGQIYDAGHCGNVGCTDCIFSRDTNVENFYDALHKALEQQEEGDK